MIMSKLDTYGACDIYDSFLFIIWTATEYLFILTFILDLIDNAGLNAGSEGRMYCWAGQISSWQHKILLIINKS